MNVVTPAEAPLETDPRRGFAARIGNWLKGNLLLHAVVIGLLALALMVAAIRNSIQVGRVERRAADDRAALIKTASDTLASRQTALLRLSALPLSWAARSALLKDELSSVDVYLQKLVREPHVTGAALIGSDGKVRLAGNRKLEGRAAADVFPGVALNQPIPTEGHTDKEIQVIVPVMGYDRRLATVILNYALPTQPEWQGTPAKEVPPPR